MLTMYIDKSIIKIILIIDIIDYILLFTTPKPYSVFGV